MAEPYFADIIDENETARSRQQQVNSSKSACTLFIKHFSAEGPLKADKLVDFVNKTFYGDHGNETKLLTKYAKGIEPSTFHCCHSKYGLDYFPNNSSNDTAYVQPLLPSGETCMKLIVKLQKDLIATEAERNIEEDKQRNGTMRHT